MLCEDFSIGTIKGPPSTEPFVDHDSQSILIASRAWMRLYLFWSHVGDCPNRCLCHHRRCAMGHCRNPKVAKHHLVPSSDYHILRFDISMNQLLIVGIL